MSKVNIVDGTGGVKPSGFYVYLHRRMTDGLVMHVGKGCKRRAWSLSGRNSFWKRVASKHGAFVEMIKDGMSEPCALVFERIQIAKYRSMGQPLTNLTDGGQGISGYSRPKSDEERVKLRNAKGASSVCCSNGMVFGTCRDAAEWVSESRGSKCFPSAINLACSGGINTAYGYSWWRMGDKEKDVVDGRVMHGLANKIGVASSNGMRYDSAKDAAAHMVSLGFTKASPSAISSACRGRIGSAYGMAWWYDGCEPRNYIPRYERSAASNRSRLTR